MCETPSRKETLKMSAQVPPRFANHLRMRRLLVQGVFATTLLLLFHSWGSVMAGVLAVAATPVLYILCTYHVPLFYHFDLHGVYLGKEDGTAVNGFTGQAPGYWVNWDRGSLTHVKLSHWNQLPAVMVQVKNRNREPIIALEREDVDRIFEFLVSISDANRLSDNG